MLNSTEQTYLSEARAGNPHDFERLVEPYRAELQLHCYRMLGSLQDAEDSLQETLLRVWRHLHTFQSRASFRAWLYRIATNVCLDTLEKKKRRVLPTVTHQPGDPQQPFSPPTPDLIWLEPFPDAFLDGIVPNPETQYSIRESVRLAFLVALQSLPPRQRAILILRDVLDWRAKEVADQLDITVSAVNSALHRARATLNRHYQGEKPVEVQNTGIDETTHRLLDQYLQAWESANVTALVALLKKDAAFTMPPSSSWYRGRADINLFLGTVIFGGQAANQWRLQPTRANAQPAFGLYKFDPEIEKYRPFAIQVLTLGDTQVADVTNFLNPMLFSVFNLPAELEN